MHRNLTLSFPQELITKAKIIAIKKNSSLSKLFVEYFKQMLTDYNEVDIVLKRILKKSQKGLYSLNNKKWKRDELYER